MSPDSRRPIVIEDDFPALARAVRERHPDASMKTRLQLSHAALHEAAHAFVALLLDVRPYNLGIRRSGRGWCHAHSYDTREILINLAGAAMEARTATTGRQFLCSARSDLIDALKFAKSYLGIEKPSQLCGPLCRELKDTFGRSDVAPLIEEIAVKVVKGARKSDGQFDSNKTHALNEWVLQELKTTGLAAELSSVRCRVPLVRFF